MTERTGHSSNYYTHLSRVEGWTSNQRIYLGKVLDTIVISRPSFPDHVLLMGSFTRAAIAHFLPEQSEFRHRVLQGADNPLLPFRPQAG